MAPVTYAANRQLWYVYVCVYVQDSCEDDFVVLCCSGELGRISSC